MAVVDEALAGVSNDLFKATIGIYAVSMVAFTAEYAFGKRGRIARTAVAPASKVLVGAGGAGSTPGPTPRVRIAPIETSGAGEVRGSAGDRFGRAAVALLLVGVVVHLGSVIARGWAVDRVPWGNMYEFSSVVALLAVSAFLVTLIKVPAVRYLGGFVMFPVLIVMFLAGTVLYAKAETLVPALQSYWLAIHVSSVACAEGLLMTSAVVTALYLLRQRADKRIATTELAADGPAPLSGLTRFGSRLPAAATLDKVAYRIVAFAFPLYTFGVICGAIWAEAAWGRYWGWDPKETWAFIAWVIYAAYLHARATAGWRRTAAWINLLGFGAMTFNFFVVNIVIAGLHSYAGVN